MLHIKNEHLKINIVIPMYNFLEYSEIYSMAWGSLCNYFRGDVADINDNGLNGKSINYTAKTTSPQPLNSKESHHCLLI